MIELPDGTVEPLHQLQMVVHHKQLPTGQTEITVHFGTAEANFRPTNIRAIIRACQDLQTRLDHELKPLEGLLVSGVMLREGRHFFRLDDES